MRCSRAAFAAHNQYIAASLLSGTIRCRLHNHQYPISHRGSGLRPLPGLSSFRRFSRRSLNPCAMKRKGTGGVLARLCSYLLETAGLSIRAKVSQPNRATYPHRLFHVGRPLTYCPLPPSGPAKRPRSAIPFGHPSPSSQRLANPTSLQPPAIAGRIYFWRFLVTPW